MIGEWKAEVDGRVVSGKEALSKAGIDPLVPEGKDALAILSNNSVAMAYAIDAARNAARIVRLTPTVYGLSLEGLNGNVAPILPQTIGTRPFEGRSALLPRDGLRSQRSAPRAHGPERPDPGANQQHGRQPVDHSQRGRGVPRRIDSGGGVLC